MTGPGRGRQLAAVATAGVGAAVLFAFRDRLGPDFWPADSSRVGPNLIASALTWALLFVLAVLLYPPFRRRVHALLDRKFDRLHARVEELHARHDQHAQSLAALHQKLDSLTQEGPIPMPDTVTQYVLVTHQPGAVGGAPDNAYGPEPDPDRLQAAGHALADGATPPMTFLVLEQRPARWDSA